MRTIKDNKFHYLYKITNLINNKIYIGVHSTNNLNDGYFGSGTIIRQSVKKYGKASFEKLILNFFDNRTELLLAESMIVNKQFIEDQNTYNIRTGGENSNIFTEEFKRNISNAQKQLWSIPEYKAKMHKIFNTDEHKKIKSDNMKNYIENNQDKWKVRIDKINHDPEKIRKTVEKHTGMKRSDEAKQNMSKSGKGKRQGSENGSFNGYYITPSGKFESGSEASKVLGIKQATLHNRCKYINNNIIGKFSLLKCADVTEEMVGKTWAECGWGFEGVV